MTCRKCLSLFLIVTFIQLTMSCVRKKTFAPEQIQKAGIGSPIVRILKTSGETLDFGKNNPAVLSGDEIRIGTRRKISAQYATISGKEGEYVIKTAAGLTFEAYSYTRDGTNLILNLKPYKSIPLSEVSMIWTSEPNNTLTALAVLGGVAAAVGIGVGIYILTKKSCPFLYASDGAELALEGELYSGAIFKGMERRDFLKLHALAAGPKGYTLKIANEADETQCTDELTLVAVDHPKDIDVCAGSDGLIHTIQSPVAALAAEDFDGRDFTGAVAAVDGEMWSSNPVGKNPENPAHWRSGLLLRFPKTAAAGLAKLTVRIGSTYWADSVFGRLFGLMGSLMQPWYQTKEQDPSIREKAEKFMSDQGVGLKVEVRGKDGWRDAGFFYPTGPYGIEDEILVLPLEGTPGDSLTVRLQGGTFFWMIDYAAVDYSPDRPVDAQALSPYEALDHNGKDITSSLIRADGDYFVMPEPGNYALVNYPAPAVKPGMVRSFLMRSAGYYTIHPGEEGAPDLMKLLAIQRNPDLFLRYSLEEIQKQFSAAADPKSAPAKIVVPGRRP